MLEEAVVEAEKVAATRKVAEDALEAKQYTLDGADNDLAAADEAVGNAEADVNTALEACTVAKKEHKEADKQVEKAKKMAETVKGLFASFQAAAAGGPDAEGVGDLKTLGQQLELLKKDNLIPESLAKAAP